MTVQPSACVIYFYNTFAEELNLNLKTFYTSDFHCYLEGQKNMIENLENVCISGHETLYK